MEKVSFFLRMAAWLGFACEGNANTDHIYVVSEHSCVYSQWKAVCKAAWLCTGSPVYTGIALL